MKGCSSFMLFFDITFPSGVYGFSLCVCVRARAFGGGHSVLFGGILMLAAVLGRD